MPSIPKPTKATRKKKVKKSKLQKKKDDHYSSYWLRKSDSMFVEIFHTIANPYCCAVCGINENLEMHHLIPRQNYCYRWHVENMILLCSDHHKYNIEVSAHGSPMNFALYIKSNYPNKWLFIRKNQAVITRKKELPFTFKEKYFDLLDTANKMNLGE